MPKQKVDDPIAKLSQALAGLPQDRSDLRPAGGAVATEVKQMTEAWRRLLIEDDAARADAAVRAVRSASASASVDDALAELERQLADAQLRFDPERDQAARAAEAIKRENEAVEVEQSDAQVAAPPMARGLGGFNIEPPATPEGTPPLKDVREPKGLKPDIIRPPSGTERFSLRAMERNSVRASDGRLLLAPKVIAAVIGIIGIALLAFPDPMRKLVDSFGRIKPLGSSAHLAIENQKGLTVEPLPLGISVADASGGETVTVTGLAEGTDLSLGTALGTGNWLVPVADLDKTFVAAPMSFVGVMTAKVTLNSATGKRLDTRNIRFAWSKPEFYSAPPAGQTEPTLGSTPRTSGRTEPTPAPGSIQSPPVSAPLRPDPSPARAANCLTSADEVRRLAPKAWPKWTYGPHGERCWYSGRKPVFQKEMPALVRTGIWGNLGVNGEQTRHRR